MLLVGSIRQDAISENPNTTNCEPSANPAASGVAGGFDLQGVTELTLNEYQRLAGRTINKELTWAQVEDHAMHGMSAEIGEIHGIYQKRYQGHRMDDGDMMKELGDLLWFCAEFATAHDWSLNDICKMNIDKLKARYPDGFTAERSVNRTE